MKWLKRLGTALALLLALTAAGLAEQESGGTVRVLLSRLGVRDSLTFRVNCDYALAEPGELRIPAGTQVEVDLADGGLKISFDGNTVDCGPDAAFLCRAEGAYGIRFLGDGISDLYCGDLHLYAEDGAIVPLLTLQTEDYVRGVLETDTAVTDPIEAVKAQAIAARSYALRKAAAETDEAYDLTDDSDGYVFAGCPGLPTQAQQAVEETRGMALCSGDAAVLCGFTESNGGRTVSPRDSENPELYGCDGKEDPYDLENRAAVQKTALIRRDGSNLYAELKICLMERIAEQMEEWGLSSKAEDVFLIRIASIVPVGPRHVEQDCEYRSLRFTLDVRSANLSTGKPVSCSVSAEVPTYGVLEKWYGLSVNPLDNETIHVSESKDAFEIKFCRNGNGVGLSKCGAYTMAADYGMDCAAILEFYFPGAEVRTGMNPGAGVPGRIAEERTLTPFALPTIAPLEEVQESEEDRAQEAAADAGSDPYTAAEPEKSPQPVAEDVFRQPAAEAPLADASGWEDEDEIKLDEDFGDFGDEIKLDEDFEEFGDEIELDEDFEELGDEIALDEDFEELGDEIALDEDFEELGDEIAPDEDFEELGDEIALDEDFEELGDEIELDEDFEELGDEIELDEDFEELGDEIELDEDFVELGDEGFEDPDDDDADEQMTAVSGETYGYVKVKASGKLTLRSRPSKNGEKKGYLKRGDRVRILESGKDWAHVKTESGREGYVSKAYLSDAMPADESGTDAWTRFRAEHADAKACSRSARARVNVRMRREASTESEILLKVSGGKTVSVLGYDDEWAYVSYKDETGFIMKKYLKFDE